LTWRQIAFGLNPDQVFLWLEEDLQQEMDPVPDQIISRPIIQQAELMVELAGELEHLLPLLPTETSHFQWIWVALEAVDPPISEAQEAVPSELLWQTLCISTGLSTRTELPEVVISLWQVRQNLLAADQEVASSFRSKLCSEREDWYRPMEEMLFLMQMPEMDRVGESAFTMKMQRATALAVLQVLLLILKVAQILMSRRVLQEQFISRIQITTLAGFLLWTTGLAIRIFKG
jgi:hypothetical protein